ncbi:MAG: guanylate kinase [Lachnospiraceae bacterium]|nr:guanylate kinase [Lachnospiraceae bacterium]MCI9659360.1 guanylate kinase [Lachnospiraceae bacterium]
MVRKGILIVVSGFSGAGKGTIMKELLRKYEQYALSVSATTREPREGEVQGKDYFFKTREAFEQMIAKGELIEYACYVNNYYGTPKAYVEEKLSEGRDVILEIEIQGARKIKSQFPEAVLLFVTTKSAQVLKERLSRRGTETQEIIDQRLERAVQESEGIEEYDYLVVNDDLEICVEEIHSIIESEHRRLQYHMELVKKVREELKGLLKGE